MVTKADLESALKDAMREQDSLRKRVLRLLLSSIKLTELEKGAPLDEPELMAAIQKEVKSRQETIAEAERAGRDDLIQENQAEIKVLQSYLPAALTPEELEELASSVIAEEGAASMADMGRVMKALTPRLQGRATGKEASDVVRRLLQAS